MVLGAAGLAQPRVPRTHRRVIETSRNGMRQLDIAGRILQDERPGALKNSRGAAGEARRVSACADRLAASFNPDEPDLPIVDEGIEEPDGVAPSADAGEEIGRAHV